MRADIQKCTNSHGVLNVSMASGSKKGIFDDAFMLQVVKLADLDASLDYSSEDNEVR